MADNRFKLLKIVKLKSPKCHHKIEQLVCYRTIRVSVKAIRLITKENRTKLTIIGNVWFVIPLLSVNKLVNTYSVYDVWLPTSRVG